MSLISINNITFAYNGKAVVSELTLDIEENDYLCVVGENGSGKTTFMKGITGLKKPSSGTISFAEGLNSYEVGYLPQREELQRDFPASVEEVVLSGRLNVRGSKTRYSKLDRITADGYMQLLGIYEDKKKCYRELSGGQQQRVLLARALCSMKRVLLLDEPASGLDPATSKEMYRIINELNKKNDITIIMITHDLLAASRYAKHILHLENKPLFYGTKDDYFKSEAAKRYLGGEHNAE